MPKRNNPNAPYFTQMRRAEKRIIEMTLELPEVGGKIRPAAVLLGVTNSFLRSRMKIVGLLPDTPPARQVVEDEPKAAQPEVVGNGSEGPQ